MSLPPGPEGLVEGTYGIHVNNKGWVPDSRLFPNKRPNKPFQVPRYLVPQHRYLTERVPEDISKLIINYAYDIGPRARLNATVLHDYNVAERFYLAIVHGLAYVAANALLSPPAQKGDRYVHRLLEGALGR